MAAIQYAVLVQVVKDELCLFDLCVRILQESEELRARSSHADHIKFIYLLCPDRMWTGRKVPVADKNEIKSIATKLGDWVRQYYPDSPTSIAVIPFKLTEIADTRQSYIQIETDCRNWYQALCRKNGIRHCIIMDGDELWRKGLLRKLTAIVRAKRPDFVHTRMVTAIGLPGYPIGGSIESATIYVRADCKLKRSRSPYGFHLSVPGRNLFHFSGVRRTMDEIVDKILSSAHVDDPNYRMRDWVDTVLLANRIRPGLRNAHMKISSNTGVKNAWPLVRRWTRAEWREIPESVKRYLAMP